MPWKETCAMDQKMKMIGNYLSREYNVTQLSELYEVSRNTIYKWVERYQKDGARGLLDKARAPLNHPNATSLAVARDIVAFKLKHRSWGPRKVVAWLEEHYPDKAWPAVSTAGNILKREGMVKHRRKKHHTPPYTEPFQECQRPNAVWSADYKGQFKTGDGKLCYPLTISDNYSRFLLCCRGLYHPNYEETRTYFEAIFQKYGLPEAVRTDNGAPFASVGLGGLSKLSVWLIKLGIKPERIEPGHPEENGRHERMHRSLKEATAMPPEANLARQQRAFGKFMPEYNNERPHEALEMKTPASCYRPSLRRYPARIPEVQYHGDVIVRQVRHNGEIKWRGDRYYVSQALAGEPVALKHIEAFRWEVRFSCYPLGILDEETGEITPMPPTPPHIDKGGKVLTMCPV